VTAGRPASPFAAGGEETESISRSDLISEVRQEARKSRGKELPGFPNARLVGELFRDQSRPWENIASDHVKSVWSAVRWFLRIALGHLTNDDTFNNISCELIDPWLDQKHDSLQQMLEMLLKPHKRGYPISYDPEFVRSFESLRLADQKLELRAKLDAHSPQSLLKGLYSWPEVESAVFSDERMDQYASSNVIESLEAYYKVIVPTTMPSFSVERTSLRPTFIHQLHAVR
jgi:hypothetical protein